MTDTTAPLLELTDASRIYENGGNQIYALNHVSFSVYPGEFVAVMGQSGSGKTTLMNIIGCLDRLSEGSYRIFGREVGTLNMDELAALRRETFGFIFQRYNLLPTLTATGNVEIPAIYAGTEKPDRDAHAHELLKSLGLGERLDHHPSQLSGGQQQRVAIARSLMNDPPVLLADEPTGALDSKSGVEVMALLKRLHQEGRTIILITHDEKVAAHAERVVHFRDGAIVREEGATAGARTKKSGRSDIGKGISLEATIREAISMAMHALRANIFRTALTLLGIIIGVAAVIAMLAAGEGSKQKVVERISAMGTDLLVVRPGAPGIRGAGDIITLTPADAEAVTRLDNVSAALPERSLRSTVRYGHTDYQTSVLGSGDLYPQVRNWPIDQGQFFSKQDTTSYAPIAVLGKTVAQILFADGDPVGQYILIKNVPFQVIGVLAAKGASAGGQDQDDTIVIPFTTGMVRLFGKTYLSSITVKVSDVGAMDATQDAITELLKQRHHTEDFSIRNMASLLETATETQDTLTLLLGVVAAISLLVGGIGVMNIMLVSVSERTREIGIRMATGARARDILLQFNIEAAVVCAVGGVLGIVVGLMAGGLMQLFGMSVVFSIFPPAMAFACAFLTGLVFGYLPARQAAQLDPVMALASE